MSCWWNPPRNHYIRPALRQSNNDAWAGLLSDGLSLSWVDEALAISDRLPQFLEAALDGTVSERVVDLRTQKATRSGVGPIDDEKTHECARLLVPVSAIENSHP